MQLGSPSVAVNGAAARAFLTAHWRHLVMVNYEVWPGVLRSLVPAGVELDVWDGKVLVSVVGFEFLGTRVLGVGIPGHRDFYELNLRFYVRRKVGGALRQRSGWRRGVVFVKELVPRRAIAWVVRCLYGERYEALRMRGVTWRGRHEADGPEWTRFIRYWWRVAGRWEGLFAEAKGEPKAVEEGSLAAFITDHAYGYSVCRGGTLEYVVEHPPWRVWEACDVRLDCDLVRLYGKALGSALGEPCSAFVAEGSPVIVRWGRRLSV